MIAMIRNRTAPIALIAALAMIGVACGNSSSSSGSPSAAPKPGGVYRTALSSFGFTGGFDPTGEYLGLAFDFYSGLLRTLVTYRHVEGPAGNVLVPDLATSVPQPTDGGLTYTFQLKPGIMFGPPLSRPITSTDIAYAFERIDSKPEVAQYAFYYDGVIGGMHQHPGPPTSISGIETPDDQTVVFHLTRPTGDFLYRLAMPATAPIPSEVARCFPTAGGYGRDVVSSGPYMIQGADHVDISSCGAIKPMSGFDPTKQLVLVRNPDYRASSDSRGDRSNFLNGISVIVDSNVSDIFNKVESGALDGSLADPPPATVTQHYLTDPSLRADFHANPGDRTWYLSMNLTTPPFDDIHVRKAVNDIIDKAALQRAWGGPTQGQIATHIMPPSVLGDQLTNSFDPYATPGEAGSLAKAQAEMKLSKYDSNHDGMCDASACKNLVMINRNYAPWTNMEPIVVDDLAKIGIRVLPRELETSAAYQTIQTVNNDIPIALNAGWGKDYADPLTFAQPLFSGASIIPTGNVNYSLVGLTSAEASRDGIMLPSGGVPSVDRQIDACEAMTLTPRLTCWINFDKNVMTNVVPWVPYLWANNITVTAPSVTRFAYDQFSGYISFTQIAVNNQTSI
jgi:peptide/nickel transport system substrate-binding protein